jgi:hypothetical protein
VLFTSNASVPAVSTAGYALIAYADSAIKTAASNGVFWRTRRKSNAFHHAGIPSKMLALSASGLQLGHALRRAVTCNRRATFNVVRGLRVNLLLRRSSRSETKNAQTSKNKSRHRILREKQEIETTTDY